MARTRIGNPGHTYTRTRTTPQPNRTRDLRPHDIVWLWDDEHVNYVAHFANPSNPFHTVCALRLLEREFWLNDNRPAESLPLLCLACKRGHITQLGTIPTAPAANHGQERVAESRLAQGIRESAYRRTLPIPEPAPTPQPAFEAVPLDTLQTATLTQSYLPLPDVEPTAIITFTYGPCKEVIRLRCNPNRTPKPHAEIMYNGWVYLMRTRRVGFENATLTITWA